MRFGLIFTLIFAFQVVLAKFEYDLPSSTRVVAVGDIHGDIDAVTKILEGMKVLSATGHWKGGKTNLIMMGDLTNKGDYGREVMDLLMKLENEAEADGGRVISLLANYELINTMGGTKNLTDADIESYASFAEAGDRSEMDAYHRAFQGNSKYARWYRARPALVRINDTLFAHGGFTLKMSNFSLVKINSLVSDWFKYHQGVGSKPDLSTRWVIGEEGPLWTRSIEPGAFELDADDMENLLKHFRANRLAVGHTVVKKLRESLYHEDFDGRVFMLETGISYAMDGKLSAVEFKDGYINSYKIKRESGEAVFKRKRKLITKDCEDLLGR